MKGQVLKVSGPVVFTDVDGAVNDLVHVGEHKLLGEIIELRKESTVVQVVLVTQLKIRGGHYRLR